MYSSTRQARRCHWGKESARAETSMGRLRLGLATSPRSTGTIVHWSRIPRGRGAGGGLEKAAHAPETFRRHASDSAGGWVGCKKWRSGHSRQRMAAQRRRPHFRGQVGLAYQTFSLTDDSTALFSSVIQERPELADVTERSRPAQSWHILAFFINSSWPAATAIQPKDSSLSGPGKRYRIKPGGTYIGCAVSSQSISTTSDVEAR